ncbi:TetR/AcrR family transcriptional regulator [Streptomyces sp. NBC_01264]|uniref:TetR/AcrR family transcriptional regulator n=1 Tax=Streptomyces sp. NBC_01264 TaxID=2903804 RepID=UPI00225439BC|nr:helix-turn-helix domain-containing protein [Streptomyces sp. NBC_01264]MCX4778792.1 TetR family transcriptional regulator [Streptomyces sp. NBC_01264]
MARPRGIEDAVILRATAQVMGRVGPAGLTLAAVAREVGLVPATLVQRFGSKRGLLLALADLSEKGASETAERVRGSHDSALGALVALTVESAAVMATPESFAHHLAFLCMDLGDPQLYERALAVHRTHGRVIGELLTEAVGAGELRGGTDVAALARTVQAIAAGAGLTWALEREGTLGQRLRQELDVVLAPHLPHPPHLPPRAGRHDLEES